MKDWLNIDKLEYNTYDEYKDSGIEWIGYIPNHYEISQIKSLFKISRGIAISKEDLIENGLYPVYSSATFNDGIFGYINTFKYKNEKLLTWTTDGVNAGKVFYREGNFNCTNVCGTLKLKLDYSYKFYKYYLDNITKHYKREDINGAKIMSNEMAKILILIPSKKEQLEIVKFLDNKTQILEQKRIKREKEITLLEEYKKTLINDVVTGKIKVIKD